MKKFIVMLFVLTLALQACSFIPAGVVVGSGKIITETIDVSGFDRIDLGTSGVLYIEQGDEYRLTIEADDNVLRRLEVEVEEGVLNLRIGDSLSMFQDITLIYRVTVPGLSAISLSGSGEIRTGAFKAETLNLSISGSGDMLITGLDVQSLTSRVSGSGNLVIDKISAENILTEVNGSGDVQLTGTAGAHQIKVSGSGSVSAGDLEATGVQVDINGSGDATVWALDELAVEISSSGHISYYGNPQVTQKAGDPDDLSHLGNK